MKVCLLLLTFCLCFFFFSCSSNSKTEKTTKNQTRVFDKADDQKNESKKTEQTIDYQQQIQLENARHDYELSQINLKYDLAYNRYNSKINLYKSQITHSQSELSSQINALNQQISDLERQMQSMGSGTIEQGKKINIQLKLQQLQTKKSQLTQEQSYYSNIQKLQQECILCETNRQQEISQENELHESNLQKIITN